MYNYPMYRDTENKIKERERKLNGRDIYSNFHRRVFVSAMTVLFLIVLLLILGFVFYYVAGH